MMSQPITDASLLESNVRLPKHVVYRTFAFEAVVLNLDSGRYHGLNPIAGRMLETLERTPRVKDAAAKLAKEFDRPQGEIEQDLCGFCRDLLSRGLIELDDAGN
jgi:Coenzyme PQQ synthesis protein D (PqqD)